MEVRPVRFSLAHDPAGKVMHVRDAPRQAQGYTCRGCEKPVMVCKGQKKQAHFKHKPQEYAPETHCDYQDETYCHKQAKLILQRLGGVRVPAVYPRCPPEYTGKLRPLRDSRWVQAHAVYNERTLYEGPDCKLHFDRQQQPFVPESGVRDFVCRPDVLFTDVADELLLLIEIHVTHAVEEMKLAGIRRAQVDTIEVTIPWHYSKQQIEQLLNITQHTKWLYNHERELAPPVELRAGQGAAPDRYGAGQICVSDPEESLECQLFEINEAVRSLTKCLGLADVREAIERLDDAQHELGDRRRELESAYQGAFDRAERVYLAELAEQRQQLSRDEADVIAALGARRSEVERTVGQRLGLATRLVVDAAAALRRDQVRLDQRWRFVESRHRRRAGILRGKISTLEAEWVEQIWLRDHAATLDGEEARYRAAVAAVEREEDELRQAEEELAFSEAEAEQYRRARADQVADAFRAAEPVRDAVARAEDAMDDLLAALTAGVARATTTYHRLREHKKRAVASRFDSRR